MLRLRSEIQAYRLRQWFTSEHEYEQREQRDLRLTAVVYKETEPSSKQSPRKVREREQQEIAPARGVDRLRKYKSI